jgi:hypothetical protein
MTSGEATHKAGRSPQGVLGKEELMAFGEILVEHRIDHRPSRFNDLHLVMPTVTDTELQTVWEQYQERQSSAAPSP